MKDTVGNFVSFIEKAVILIILVSTITAIIFEILKMIDAFNTKFTQLEHGQARKSGGREYYVFRKN